MLRLFLLYFIHLKQICKAEVSLIILIYESKVFFIHAHHFDDWGWLY